MTPDISIIIPVYKAEAVLPQCLDSVLQDAPQNCEIILVDDGSPDGSPAICDQYAQQDNRIHVIHTENSGASAARNTGLAHSTGSRVFFLDSDDYPQPGYFDKLLACDADLVLGNFRAFYEDGHADFCLDVSQASTHYNLPGFLKDFHIFFPTIFNFPWGHLYRRDILQNNNITFDRSIAINEDLLFNLAYYQHCKEIAFVPDAVIMYRQSSSSLSKRSFANAFDWYKQGYDTIYELLLRYDAFTDENKAHFYIRYFRNIMECMIGLVRSDPAVRSEKLRQICSCEQAQEAMSFNKSRKYDGIVRAAKKQRIGLLTFRLKTHLFFSAAKKCIGGAIK